jgi:hypothetical protein
VQYGQSLHSGTRLFAGVSGGGKHGGDDFADGLFVVNDKNTIRHGFPRSLSAIVTEPRDAESNHSGPETAWINRQGVIFRNEEYYVLT